MIHSISKTVSGRRSYNQDTVGEFSELRLFVVADGLGGYKGGEVASRLAVEAMREHFERRGHIDSRVPDVPGSQEQRLDDRQLELAVYAGQRAVASNAVGELADMGTTVVALWVRDKHVVIAHVGDSRLYRWRGGRLQQLTRDHSLLAEMTSAGSLAMARSLYGSSFSSAVTRSLGRDTVAIPDMRVEQLEAGDVFLLCSDGLTEGLTDNEIAEVMRSASDDKVADGLVQAAYDVGSGDNISVLVVRPDWPDTV